jgi:hypothetical protein
MGLPADPGRAMKLQPVGARNAGGPLFIGLDASGVILKLVPIPRISRDLGDAITACQLPSHCELCNSPPLGRNRGRPSSATCRPSQHVSTIVRTSVCARSPTLCTIAHLRLGYRSAGRALRPPHIGHRTAQCSTTVQGPFGGRWRSVTCAAHDRCRRIEPIAD